MATYVVVRLVTVMDTIHRLSFDMRLCDKAVDGHMNCARVIQIKMGKPMDWNSEIRVVDGQKALQQTLLMT